MDENERRRMLAAALNPQPAPAPLYGTPSAVQPRQPDFRAAGLEPPPANFLDAMQQNKVHNARAAQMLWEMTPPGSFMSAVDAADRGDGLGVVMGAIGAVPIPGAGALGAGGKGLRMAGKAAGIAGDATKGIRAYHGSPHSFDRFDLSKIGTGEGAQAYGHGLYFAGAEDVARVYRDNLSRAHNTTYGGGKPDWSNPEHIAAAWLHNFNGERKAAADYLRGSWASVPGVGEKERRTFEEAARLLESGAPVDVVRRQAPGHMYEVNLRVSPDQLLDWDSGGESVYRSAGKRGGVWKPEQATEALRNAGIPGIRYLDQGSRSAGDGTSNYVLFDDKLIDILRKYGIVPLAAGGAAAGSIGGLVPAPEQSY